MIVFQLVVAEESDEEEVVVDEGAHDVGVGEADVGHSGVVDAQGFVDSEFVLCYFFGCPLVFVECSDFEDSIVKICDGIIVTFCVLLDLLYFDILIFLSTYLLRERILICFQVIHVNIIFLIAFFRHYYGSCGII